MAASYLGSEYSPILSRTFNQAIQEATTLLANFLTDADFSNDLLGAFGNTLDTEAARSLLRTWTADNFSGLPSLEIRPTADINRANGAFAAATNTIYISQEFLTQNIDNVGAVTSLLLEELGHALDWHSNIQDAPGDEGAIFASLVQGNSLDANILAALKTEDDTANITLDGQLLQIEQATVGVNPAFDLIGLTQLRNDTRFAGIDGSGMTVAVIDTGLDRTHPLLQPNYVAGRDFVNNSNDPIDNFQHGTHVSGTVGATDPNIGVAPDANLIGLQVFSSGGGAYSTDIEEALEWVLANRQQYNIVAVNMSLGGGFYTSATDASSDIYSDDIQRLEQAGITVVSAGGNSFKDNEYPNFGSPAILSTLAVGAVWQDGVNSFKGWGSGATDYTTGADRVTSFSQRLNAPNTIFAPGAMINSTVPGGGIQEMAGTSMASPIVAGAVALMQEAAMQFGGRLLSPDEVVSIMRSTADTIFDGDDEDDNVQNTNQNYPRLNIYNAVAEIQRLFQGIAPPPPGGGSGDPNGTIAGGILGPTLNGDPVNPILGTIGVDGGTVNVGDKDVDIFRFEVVSPGTVTIELGPNTSNPSNFDTLLRLFNSSGTELAFDDDSGTDSFSRLSTALTPGTYYAGISGYNNRSYNPNVAGSGVSAATGNYSLQFSLTNPDPNGLISGAVPVNLGTSREPLEFNGFIGADNGSPVGVSDVDLFEIRVPDNGTLYIDIDTPFDDGEYVDSFVRVFDANGNELTFSDDELSVDASGNPTEFTDSNYPDLVFEDPSDRTYYHGHTTDSFIVGDVDRGDVYYIGVSDYFNDSYNPNNLDNRPATGTGGYYNLIVNFGNNDLNGIIPQAINRSLPTTGVPGTIGADGNPQTGQLVQVGDRDVDFTKFRSATAGILEIDIDSYDSPSISTPVDSVVFLYDANGNLLDFNDDSGDSLDPLLRYQINANTDYFVAVSGYGNDNFDPFAPSSGSPGDTGDYIFNSRLLPLSQSSTLSDNGANNGAVQNATVGSQIFANIGDDNGFSLGASDVDIYRFTPTTSGTFDIRTSTYQEYSADTFLRFFNANGTQIAANDNENNSTRGSLLRVSVTAGTQYLIGVNGASPQAANYNPITGAGAANGSQGDYILSITGTASSNSIGPDFNRDGSTDILWRNRATGDNAIWLMNGTNLSQGTLIPPVSDTNWHIGGAGDFNSDGQTDILWRNAANGQNAMWLMNGTNLSQGVSITPVAGSNWSIGGTGDFNGDNQTDILWRDELTGQNAIWLMNGTNIAQGVFTTPVTDTNWDIGGTGDFNGDNQTDILWRNSITGQNAAWLMNGTNLAQGALITEVADTNWQMGGTGDYNRDGQTDILWRNQSNGQDAVWLMNGTNISQGTLINPVADTNWQIGA